MKKYFCEKLVLKREALRISYICSIDGKICPMVRYGEDGSASPSVLFTKRGCWKNVVEEVSKPVKKEEKVNERKTEEVKIQPKPKKQTNKRTQTNKRKNNKTK